MNKTAILRKLIILLAFVFMASCTYATTLDDKSFKKDSIKYINQLDNIRKQFLGISEKGYYAHIKNESNTSNVILTKIYIDQIEPIITSIRTYGEVNTLDKFQKITINTMIATAIYLQTMGQNLIDYLEATDLEEQYNAFKYHVQINEFIVNIIGNLITD